MTQDTLFRAWEIGTIIFGVLSFIGSFVYTMESRHGYYRRANARIALKCYAALALCWAWPFVVPMLIGRLAYKTMEIAEVEGPVDKWKARQALKIQKLEDERRALKRKQAADALRIEELEVDCGIRKEVSDATRALASRRF